MKHDPLSDVLSSVRLRGAIFYYLTHEEVASILGSSVGTVKSNLFHALGNLRRAMAGAREMRS